MTKSIIYKIFNKINEKMYIGSSIKGTKEKLRKPKSEEERARMSATRKGKPWTAARRKAQEAKYAK